MNSHRRVGRDVQFRRFRLGRTTFILPNKTVTVSNTRASPFSQTRHSIASGTAGPAPELHELNPFGNPNSFTATANGYQTAESTTSFNEYGGYQQDGTGGGGLHHRQSSVASTESSFACEGEGRSDVKIDEYQAAWNVTNAIQGMFIVSLPFAVQRGGYWAIIAMVGIAHICCYTGKCLVKCLYEPDPQTGQMVRVRESYVSIAKVCFGAKYGARAVNIAQIIELLMTCILYVVVCGDLMAGTFPEGALDSRY